MSTADFGRAGESPRQPATMTRTIAAIAGLVAGIESEIGGSATVGIGIPGTIVAATGLVKNANSTWLIGRPLGRDVEAALGRPVRFANDADCFALSEATDGAAAGMARCSASSSAPASGGGIVDRRPAADRRQRDRRRMGAQPAAGAGSRRNAGSAPAIAAGRGCIETFLSGPGLAADHRRHTGQALSRAADRRRRRRRRPGLPGDARPLRRPAGARPRGR